VQILLRWGEVHPYKSDQLGKTLLTLDAYNRHHTVVKILLGQEVVNFPFVPFKCVSLCCQCLRSPMLIKEIQVSKELAVCISVADFPLYT